MADDSNSKVTQTPLPTKVKPARLATKLTPGDPDRKGAYSNHTGEVERGQQR